MENWQKAWYVCSGRTEITVCTVSVEGKYIKYIISNSGHEMPAY